VYRLARIYDDLGQHDKAVTTYETAIRLWQNSTQYYAARAALQIGLIYEEQKKYTEAIKQYERCVNMKDHDYENSLEQKAKAGINRCRQGR
jgi:tetratricopeptide (TPR) repeat protein